MPTALIQTAWSRVFRVRLLVERGLNLRAERESSPGVHDKVGSSSSWRAPRRFCLHKSRGEGSGACLRLVVRLASLMCGNTTAYASVATPATISHMMSRFSLQAAVILREQGDCQLLPADLRILLISVFVPESTIYPWHSTARTTGFPFSTVPVG